MDSKQFVLNAKLSVDAAAGRAQLQGAAGDLGAVSASSKTAAKEVESVGKAMSRTSEMAQLLKGALTGAAIVGFTKTVMGAATQAESSLKGLESIANYTGVGMAAALQTAGKLSADGMMATAEASRALQNLLSRGYSIDQAEATLNRLKDAAAFNRQAHLGMGEAVVTASEGLKNENSILVDNAGVTKNVGQMWKEYAQKVGVGVDSLTTAQKIQAEYSGLLRETQGQLGNAAKAAQGYQGAQAELNKTLLEFEAHVGQSLTPVMTDLVKGGSHVITDFLDPFIDKVKAAGVWTGFLVQSVSALGHGDFDKLDRDYVSALHWRDMGAAKPAGAAASGANPQKAAAFQAGLSGAEEADARDKKAIAKSDLELAEAKAKAEHNVRALTDAYAGQLMAEGKLSASAARHVAEQNAQKDALGWTASASKALETTQASLADKVNDMEIALRLEAASLGLSERETAGLEAAKKLLTETNAKGLAQLQQEPAVVERAIELGRRQYDVDMARAEAKRQLTQSIDNFNSRQGIANGLTLQADRAQRELSTMHGLQSNGYFGERLQREMNIRRQMMDEEQKYINSGSRGLDLAASMRQAEQNIRTTEAAQWELNETLNKTNDLGHELGMTFSSAFEDAVVKGGDLRSVLAGVLQDIERIAIRTAVTEPLGKFLSSAFGNAFNAMLGGPVPAGTATFGPVQAAGLQPSGVITAGLNAGGTITPIGFGSGFGGGAMEMPLSRGAAPAAASGAFTVHLIDQRPAGGAPLSVSTEASPGPDGMAMLKIYVRELVQRETPGAMHAAFNSGAMDTPMGRNYNIRRTGKR